MLITIDPKAGYCFGVRNAVGQAEAILEEDGPLYSLGSIVHNKPEVEHLESKGLKVISYGEFSKLRDCRVLIRAHGEPPSTYETAYRNNITLIDATCPIVKHIQRNIRQNFAESAETNSQLVIYGKKGHPEVNGLAGQTEGQAIIVFSEEDIKNINPTKTVHLYSQTTMQPEGFDLMAYYIRAYLKESNSSNPPEVVIHNTICRQVTNRVGHLGKFAADHQVILFVAGKQSSNGRFLSEICRNSNPKTYQIENINEIDSNWFSGVETVGITGATSTPEWLLGKVADYLASMNV